MMTNDQKDRVETQAHRDCETFLESFQVRIQRTQGLNLSEEEARAILGAAISKKVGAPKEDAKPSAARSN